MRLSLRLSSDLEPDAFREGAREAAAAGMQRVWLADNPRERSSIVTASYIAALEPTLGIGLGIVSARERHPVVLTQELLALQGYCSQPVIAGLGLGSGAEIELLGLPNRSGLALLRETTQIVRDLSSGREIAAFGGGAKTFGLKFKEAALPVYVGAIGPKTLRLAGEIADGVVLSLGTTARAAHTAVSTATSGDRSADLGGMTTVCYVAFGGLDDDSVNRMQAFAAHMLTVCSAQPALAVLLEGTGVGAAEAAELVAAYERGTELPTEVVDSLTIAGPVEHCIRRIRAYEAAGVDEIALGIGRWNTSLGGAVKDAGRLIKALASCWVDT
jgi:5,10-methylenetetrahydromethanopterin reductase